MATQINSFYHQHAMEYATISDDGLTVTLPSEKEENVTYQVRCEHTANGIEVVDCQCRGFRRWAHCKHQDIVQDWQDNHYIAPKITEIEKGRWYIVNSDTQIWLNEDDEWLVAGPTTRAIEIIEDYLEKQEAVKTAEEIVAQPVVEQEETHYTMSPGVYAKLKEIAKQEAIKKATPCKGTDPYIERMKKEIQLDDAKNALKSKDLDSLKAIATSRGLEIKSHRKRDYVEALVACEDLGTKGNLNTSRAFQLMRQQIRKGLPT